MLPRGARGARGVKVVKRFTIAAQARSCASFVDGEALHRQ
jgi:hypothetical protein